MRDLEAAKRDILVYGGDDDEDDEDEDDGEHRVGEEVNRDFITRNHTTAPYLTIRCAPHVYRENHMNPHRWWLHQKKGANLCRGNKRFAQSWASRPF